MGPPCLVQALKQMKAMGLKDRLPEQQAPWHA
jgi:hypothetical protein